jgi:hypothetical protein
MRRIAALLLFAALPVSAASYPMAGTWFGTGQPNDKSEMYIDSFGADFTFHNQHRWCRQGKATDLRESGHWIINGDILTIEIETVDGQKEPRRDNYRLLSVDAKSQNYVFIPNNFAYHAHKVAADFAMPPCDLVS